MKISRYNTVFALHHALKKSGTSSYQEGVR